MAKKFTTLDYCQYLLSSQINHTITNLADHIKGYSHDQINRYLKTEKLTPRVLWENVKATIVSDEGKYMYVLFDDSGGVDKYKWIDQLNWSEKELLQGKLIKIHKFPKDKKVKLFWVTVSPSTTEYVVTNDLQRFALKPKPRDFLKGLLCKPFKKSLVVRLIGNCCNSRLHP